MKTPLEAADDSGGHSRLAQLMGLVVALRFLCWSALIAALCGLLLVEASRHPKLLSFLTLPSLLAFYLGTSGQVLLLIRLGDWRSRLLALGPALTLGLLCLPAARSSPKLAALALVAGLWLYLGAFSRQATIFEHGRTLRWFLRMRWGLIVLLVLALTVPGAAAPLTVFGGMLCLGALVVGWRVWLMELRDSIAERENV